MALVNYSNHHSCIDITCGAVVQVTASAKPPLKQISLHVHVWLTDPQTCQTSSTSILCPWAGGAEKSRPLNKPSCCRLFLTDGRFRLVCSDLTEHNLPHRPLHLFFFFAYKPNLYCFFLVFWFFFNQISISSWKMLIWWKIVFSTVAERWQGKHSLFRNQEIHLCSKGDIFDLWDWHCVTYVPPQWLFSL